MSDSPAPNTKNAIAVLIAALKETGAGVCQIIGRETDGTPRFGVVVSNLPRLVENLDVLANASNEADDETLPALCRAALFADLHLYEVGGIGECEVVLARVPADVVAFGGDPATVREVTLDEARKVYGNEGELTLCDTALACALAGNPLPAQIWTCHN